MARVPLTIGPQTRELLAALDEFFRERGVAAYVTGGFLRDALLARASRDVDLSIDGDPLEAGPALADAMRGSYFALSEEQAIVRIVAPELGAQVDLLPLRGEIENDLRRRDFTIDAMAASLTEAASGKATVIDPTGGRDDLRRRLVRAVSEEAFRQDPLRPLRGARLAVELEFTIEAATTELIRTYAANLPEAAAERQRDELMRILATDRAGEGMRLLDDLRLLEVILPEMTGSRGVEQPKEHHWDVFGHLLAAVGNLDMLLGEREPSDEPQRELWRALWTGVAWWEGARGYFREQMIVERPRSAVLKLAALLHDIGKPETKTFEESGRMRFFGHADVGADKAAAILRRLRFSSREVSLVRAMVKAHLRPVQMGQQGPPTRRAVYRYFRDCGDDAGMLTLFLSLADHLATVGPRVDIEGWRQHVALVNYILAKRLQEEETIMPPRLLGGDELMTELDLSPGPLIGRFLETIAEAQAAGDIATREDALELARSLLARRRTARSASGSDQA
ncbi:MAG: HD domain-containing protein [Dehalococcoidia bacterium]